MSQDQAQADLIQQNIDEVEGTSVDLKTALEEEKAAAKAEKTAAKDAAKQAKLDEKTAKAEQTLAAKQAKLDEKAAKVKAFAATKAKRLATKEAKQKAPKEPRINKNGINLPNPNTSASMIWELITLVSSKKGEMCKPADVQAILEDNPYIDKKGIETFINPGNVSPEFWTYKKFYGLTASA